MSNNFRWYDKLRKTNEPLNQKVMEWAVAHGRKLTVEEQERYNMWKAYDDAHKQEK